MPSQSHDSIALMPVTLGGQSLAIEALVVLEILGPQQWVAIPNAPAMLPGALAWRGRAVGVLDLGSALELPPLVAPVTRSRNLILRVAEDTLAMSVDRVLEVRRVSAGEISAIHAAGWIVDSGLPCRGETELGDAIIPILDLDAWGRATRRGR